MWLRRAGGVAGLATIAALITLAICAGGPEPSTRSFGAIILFIAGSSFLVGLGLTALIWRSDKLGATIGMVAAAGASVVLWLAGSAWSGFEGSLGDPNSSAFVAVFATCASIASVLALGVCASIFSLSALMRGGLPRIVSHCGFALALAGGAALLRHTPAAYLAALVSAALWFAGASFALLRVKIENGSMT